MPKDAFGGRWPGGKRRNHVKEIKDIALDTEKNHESFEQANREEDSRTRTFYQRFNVEDGLEAIKLDTWKQTNRGGLRPRINTFQNDVPYLTTADEAGFWDTRDTIEEATRGYLGCTNAHPGQSTVPELVTRCAERIVEKAQARREADLPRWRYHTGIVIDYNDYEREVQRATAQNQASAQTRLAEGQVERPLPPQPSSAPGSSTANMPAQRSPGNLARGLNPLVTPALSVPSISETITSPQPESSNIQRNNTVLSPEEADLRGPSPSLSTTSSRTYQSWHRKTRSA